MTHTPTDTATCALERAQRQLCRDLAGMASMYTAVHETVPNWIHVPLGRRTLVRTAIERYGDDYPYVAGLRILPLLRQREIREMRDRLLG